MAGYFDEFNKKTPEQAAQERLKLTKNKLERKILSGYDDIAGKLLDAQEKRQKLLENFEKYDVNAVINAEIEIEGHEDTMRRIAKNYEFMFGVPMPQKSIIE